MTAALGFQEILVIVILTLIVFGPKRLPDLARQVGRLTRELRKLAWEFRSALELETFTDDHEPASATESDPEYPADRSSTGASSASSEAYRSNESENDEPHE